MAEPSDNMISDVDVWNMIYDEAYTLYTEYLNISSFQEIFEVAESVNLNPTHVPNYDIPMTIKWENGSQG